MSDEAIEEEVTQTPEHDADSPWYSDMGLDDSSIGYLQKKGWENPKAMFDSYRNLEKLKGAPEDRLLTLPEEQLPENMGDIWNRLGRPENIDGYEVDLPDGVSVNPARMDAMRKVAHEGGVSKATFAKMAKVDAEYYAQEQKAYEEQLQSELKSQEVELKNEWGSRYDESVFMAQKGMREMGLTDDQKESLQIGLGYDGMMKFFHKVAMAMGEGAFVEGEKKSDFGMTPEMARHEMDNLLSRAGNDPAVRAQWQKKAGPDYSRYKQLMAIRHGS